MNDHLPTDQRQLEQATSLHSNGTANGLDANTVAARQAWLAAGVAAEAAGREGLNEQALLASLQAEWLTTRPAEPHQDSPPHFDWSWAAVGVAGAVLLMAVVIGALSQRRDAVPGIGPAPQVVQPSPPVRAPVEPTVPESEKALVKSTPTASLWDDLDETIQETYTALQQLSDDQNGVDQALTDFDAQLKQLSAEIAGESL